MTGVYIPDRECRYWRSRPLTHVCTDRDGRPLTIEDQPCWYESRAQLIEDAEGIDPDLHPYGIRANR